MIHLSKKILEAPIYLPKYYILRNYFRKLIQPKSKNNNQNNQNIPRKNFRDFFINQNQHKPHNQKTAMKNNCV